MKQHVLIEHLFRHEYGRLVASLLRRFGVQYLENIEDAVQFSMKQALDSWSLSKTPGNPSAWMYQVAYRQVLTELRNEKRRKKILEGNIIDADVEEIDIPLSGKMADSMLRMLFVTCHSDIPVESQLVFTLKSLCGFSIKEIALRLFISEENVYKRFSRARLFLKKEVTQLDYLTPSEMKTRLPMVQRVLYLVFTEGHLTSQSDMGIRIDLCHEAIRLTLLLSKSKEGDAPETFALLALMYLHLSKMNSRQDDSGTLLLLEQQDRNLWDKKTITTGLSYLQTSAQGSSLSRYHVEANIVAEHCLASSFKNTRWHKIAKAYELLESIAPSVLNQLNRAIALAECESPKVGLSLLNSINIPVWLNRSYHWNAVLADLQFRDGNYDIANENANLAIRKAPTNIIKELLKQRYKQYGYNLET